MEGLLRVPLRPCDASVCPCLRPATTAGAARSATPTQRRPCGALRPHTSPAENPGSGAASCPSSTAQKTRGPACPVHELARSEQRRRQTAPGAGAGALQRAPVARSPFSSFNPLEPQPCISLAASARSPAENLPRACAKTMLRQRPPRIGIAVPHHQRGADLRLAPGQSREEMTLPPAHSFLPIPLVINIH